MNLFLIFYPVFIRVTAYFGKKVKIKFGIIYVIHYLCLRFLKFQIMSKEIKSNILDYASINKISANEKSITPPTLSFEELISAYTSDLKFKPASLQGALNPVLKNDLNRVIYVLNKHKNVLSEIEDEILNFLQKSIHLKPPVYVARTKDPKTEIEYFNAKTFVPVKGGGKKEIKVYLGKAIDFDNDTKSIKAKILGEKLLKKAIEEKGKNGEF
jgi:hypothetical protein